MKTQQIYTEVKYDDLTPEEQSNIIEFKWVFRDKTTEVRARIVAKRFTEVINNLDSIYASTPMFCILRALARSWDITTAFLHATAATSNLYMSPPAEFYSTMQKIGSFGSSTRRFMASGLHQRRGRTTWHKHCSSSTCVG